MDVSDDADRLQTLLYSSYSADVVRQLERPLLDDGVPLMRKPGFRCDRFVRRWVV